MRPRTSSASWWWIGAAVLLTAAMLLGRFGVGTYSPVALALVAASLFFCVRTIWAHSRSQTIAAESLGGRARVVFAAMVLLSAGLGVATLRWTPPERVDVYVFQRDAVAALLHGVDPYSITHPDIYGRQSAFFYDPSLVANGRVQIGCPYPPLSLLFDIPGYLAGDLRYSCLLALLLSGVLLWRMQPSRAALAAVALLLLNPVSLYVLSRGWTEPLVLLTLSWTCWAALRRSRWLPLALGAFFASKQYALVGVPLAGFLLPAWSWRRYLKLLLLAGLVAGILTLPFAAWNFHDFWKDIVIMQVIQPFRPDSLSFSVLARRVGLPLIPQAVVAVAVAAAMAWAAAVSRKDSAGFAAGLGLVMLVFFCLNKQAFVNYYFLVIGAVLVAAVAADAPSGMASGEAAGAIRSRRVAASDEAPITPPAAS